jgi:hypothetical protein
MKLGTETGSLQNHLYSRMIVGAPEPTPGTGATVLHWTDREAATVQSFDPKLDVVVVTLDRAARTDSNGMSEEQTYSFERDPDGQVYVFKRDRQGMWREARLNGKGRVTFIPGGGSGLLVGARRHYYDFSF